MKWFLTITITLLTSFPAFGTEYTIFNDGKKVHIVSDSFVLGGETHTKLKATCKPVIVGRVVFLGWGTVEGADSGNFLSVAHSLIARTTSKDRLYEELVKAANSHLDRLKTVASQHPTDSMFRNEVSIGGVLLWYQGATPITRRFQVYSEPLNTPNKAPEVQTAQEMKRLNTCIFPLGHCFVIDHPQGPFVTQDHTRIDAKIS